MLTDGQSDEPVTASVAVSSSRSAIGLDSDYEAAMNSVRSAIENFRGCSPNERAALQRDLDQLHSMAEKLATGKVEIVVFGEISTGKSCAHQRTGWRSRRRSKCPRWVDQGRVERRLERCRLLCAGVGRIPGRAD